MKIHHEWPEKALDIHVVQIYERRTTRLRHPADCDADLSNCRVAERVARGGLLIGTWQTWINGHGQLALKWAGRGEP